MDDQIKGRPARWLNATVLAIGQASLFSDVGHEMATVAMPALLASIDAGPAALGLIEGLADGLSSFVKLLSGHYSDRLRRRKPLAVAGYFLTAAGMASFALATQWWHVLLGRVVGWLGRGARSPVRKVLLAEATTPETYGRAFGFERAMDTAGAVVGPLLAIALTAALGLKWVFAVTFVPGIAAALLIVFLVREREHTPKPHRSVWGGLRQLPGTFRRYLLGVGFAGLGDFSNALLVLWATVAFGDFFDPNYRDESLRDPDKAKLAAALAMGYYVGYNVIYMLSSYFSGQLADRLPKNRVLAIGYALAVVPAAALLLPVDPFVRFGVAFAFSGLYMGVWETVESATAAALLPGDVRGAGFGLLDTVNGIGDLVSSIAVGVLWGKVHPAVAMGYVIIMSLAGAAVVASLPPVERPPAE